MELANGFELVVLAYEAVGSLCARDKIGLKPQEGRAIGRNGQTAAQEVVDGRGSHVPPSLDRISDSSGQSVLASAVRGRSFIIIHTLRFTPSPGVCGTECNQECFVSYSPRSLRIPPQRDSPVTTLWALSDSHFGDPGGS